LVWESILLVFLLGLGTFQVIASWADFKGISFFKHRIVGCVFGVVLIISAFAWFFIAVKVGEGGPKGQHDDQALSTLIGGGLVLLLTGFVPSIIKYRSYRKHHESADSSEGIEVFKQMTLLQAIHHRSNTLGKDK